MAKPEHFPERYPECDDDCGWMETLDGEVGTVYCHTTTCPIVVQRRIDNRNSR